MDTFRQISPRELTNCVFDWIGKNWMLITAQNQDAFNTMTASWGGMGFLWNKPVSFIVVRPSRYTFSFLEQADRYTLSFLGEAYREALNFCGKYSGRDVDKVKQTGLTPVQEDGVTYFAQADTVLVCKKRYAQMFDPKCFPDAGFAQKMYGDGEYHKLYIGEIERVLVK